jgi:hypothetical protein
MVSDIKPLYENTEKSYKGICDGLECSNTALKKIDTSAGEYGTISLNLCSVCLKKFNRCDEEMKNAGHRKSPRVANGGADFI